MSATTTVELVATCDHFSHKEARDGGKEIFADSEQAFVGISRRDVKQRARAAGWILGKNNAICPKHSGKRRR